MKVPLNAIDIALVVFESKSGSSTLAAPATESAPPIPITDPIKPIVGISQTM